MLYLEAFIVLEIFGFSDSILSLIVYHLYILLNLENITYSPNYKGKAYSANVYTRV